MAAEEARGHSSCHARRLHMQRPGVPRHFWHAAGGPGQAAAGREVHPGELRGRRGGASSGHVRLAEGKCAASSCHVGDLGG